jgi:FkbH-like protein
MDWEELTGTFGKRFIQDDGITTLNHGSFMGDMHSPKETYLTPMGSLDRLYHRRGADIVLAIFNECVAMHNVLSSDNKIKLVIFDLDNTLWSGVAAEMNDVEPGMAEGWPIGILEAAAFLKKRGILLGLASKNDPDVAIKAWDAIYGRRFPLANFVSTKFSWESKATSVAKILTETNLLPSNALFVDDNPIEREQVQKALPEIKVLEGPVYTWRRTLLWAAELQVPFVSSESAQRTASVRSSINRETLRLELDEERYLRDLAVTIKFDLIDNTKHLKFARAHELLNKTNQFNTTGRRWSEQDMAEFFADGGKVLTADVADRLSNYGLTALILMRSMNCVQMVMSCRVFGLRVEFALLAEFLALGHGQRLISFRSTGKNALCKKFFHHVKLSLPEGDVSSDTVEITLAADYQLPSGLADTVHIGI